MSQQSIQDFLANLPTMPGGVANGGHFAGQGQFPSMDLSVEVEGFGAFGRPMAPDQAAALQQRSQPARFGRRTQTVLDAAVRDTGEIPSDELHLAWAEGTFARLQSEIAQALGVERLECRLHNGLVYGQGQFFKPHQDTEKHPGMIGTAVLIWPSPHIGGELRVALGSKTERFASQHLRGGDSIRWFAFYADCRHEVLPVEEGWRVALTMDLVLPATVAPSSAAHPGLRADLRELFGLDGEPRLKPWVVLLDHEYTERGLRWPLLKGDDRTRVMALRAAADELGLTVDLALAEIHESWTAYEDQPRRGARHDPEPDELIDESMVLDFWVDANNRLGPRASLNVKRDDAICFAETDEAFLVNSEYEGYMGNYGETLDYWYRRAALVIQSPMAAERTRFTTDFDAALADLRKLAREPDAKDALAARVGASLDLLRQAASAQGRPLLAAYCDIAAAMPDAEAATALMANFRHAELLAADVKPLVQLERARGTPWMQALLKRWTEPTRSPFSFTSAAWPSFSAAGLALPRLWQKPLNEFTRACLGEGMSPALMDDWLRAHHDALLRFDAALVRAAPAERMALQSGHLELATEFATTLRAVATDSPLLERLVDHVAGLPGIYPATALAGFVVAAGATASRMPAVQPLRQRVESALRVALAEPPRTAGDHALRGVEWTCRCQDCAAVVRWAESPDATALTLPMAEPRRQHVEAALRTAGAAVATATLKKGSPYKLQLTKSAGLHRLEAALRAQWQRDLDALQA